MTWVIPPDYAQLTGVTMVQRLKDKISLLFKGREGWFADEEIQQEAILFLLGISAATLAIFSSINYLSGHQWLAYVQLATFFMFFPLYYIRVNRIWIKNSRRIFLSLALFSFAALFIDGGIGDTGVYWSLTYPFFVFMLLGVRRGWHWLAAAMLLYCFLMLLYAQDMVLLSYSDETLTYAPAMFLFFSVIACTSINRTS